MSNTRQQTRLAAERYAEALYELALEQKKAEQTGDELTALEALLQSSPQLAAAMHDPTIAKAQKASAIEMIARRAGYSDVLIQFAARLARNGRFDALSVIVERYRARLLADSNIEQVEIRVARPLDASGKANLQKALEKALGRKVAMREEVRPLLIGGITLTIGSKLLDLSVQGKLNRLEAALQETIARG